MNLIVVFIRLKYDGQADSYIKEGTRRSNGKHPGELDHISKGQIEPHKAYLAHEVFIILTSLMLFVIKRWINPSCRHWNLCQVSFSGQDTWTWLIALGELLFVFFRCVLLLWIHVRYLEHTWLENVSKCSICYRIHLVLSNNHHNLWILPRDSSLRCLARHYFSLVFTEDVEHLETLCLNFTMEWMASGNNY